MLFSFMSDHCEILRVIIIIDIIATLIRVMARTSLGTTVLKVWAARLHFLALWKHVFHLRVFFISSHLADKWHKARLCSV